MSDYNSECNKQKFWVLWKLHIRVTVESCDSGVFSVKHKEKNCNWISHQFLVKLYCLAIVDFIWTFFKFSRHLIHIYKSNTIALIHSE